MKKIIVAILLIVIIGVGCVFLSKNRNAAVTDLETANVEPDAVGTNLEDDNSTAIDNEEVKQILLQILYNEQKFTDTEGNLTYLKDYNPMDDSNFVKVEQFCFVDFDGDGIEELLDLTKSQNGFYILFHYDKGTIQAYPLSIREIYNPKTDGSFYASGGATTYGYHTIKFNGAEIESKVLASRADDLYHIEDKIVSKEEFEEFEKKQDAKTDVVWETLKNYVDEEENILDFGSSNEIVYTWSYTEAGSEYLQDTLTLRKDGTAIKKEETIATSIRTGTYTVENEKITINYVNETTIDPDGEHSRVIDETGNFEFIDGKLYEKTATYTHEFVRK